MEEGYNPAYGARPLRRAIMRLLEDSMAERMLTGDIKEGDSVIIDVDADGQVGGPSHCLATAYRDLCLACMQCLRGTLGSRIPWFAVGDDAVRLFYLSGGERSGSDVTKL